jgi:tRNA 2-selenouridine synthase
VALAKLPDDRPIWVEDESRTIGGLGIPASFFEQMRAAPLLILDVPQAARVQYLAADYGRHDAGGLAAAVLRLRKRLGGLVTKEALGAIADGDMPRMVELVLAYYDKAYGYGLTDRPAITVAAEGTDAAANAALVLASANEMQPLLKQANHDSEA